MFRAIVNNQRVSLAEAFRLYGTNVTQWPTSPTCLNPDCGKVVIPWGKNLLIAGNHIQYEGEHRTPDNHHPRYNHRKGEGKDCIYGTKDSSAYDDLTPATSSDPGAAARFKAECLQPEIEARTIAMLGFILGCKSNRKNFSLGLYLDVLEIADKNNMWGLNIPTWFTPYALVQQRDFVREFSNEKHFKVRYLREVVACQPDFFSPDGQREVIATYFANGKNRGSKTYIPDVPVSEHAVATIYAAHKAWAEHKIEKLQAEYANHPARSVKLREASAQDIVTAT